MTAEGLQKPERIQADNYKHTFVYKKKLVY